MDIITAYKQADGIYYTSFRVIDIKETLERQQLWEEKHQQYLPLLILAKIIVQQRVEEWMQKYNKNPDNIRHLVKSIIEG